MASKYFHSFETFFFVAANFYLNFLIRSLVFLAWELIATKLSWIFVQIVPIQLKLLLIELT